MKDVAITTYIDNKPNIITEFGWLYCSWLFSKSNQVSKIIAFHHPQIPIKNLPQDDNIIYVPLLPLAEEDATWGNYPFINSIWYLTTSAAEFLKDYNYVLRTDNDCFLTPYFLTLRPRLATFGIGMFATEPDVTIRLANIAKKWGLYTPFNNVGSTLMAHSTQALEYSQIQLDFCYRLRSEEFTEGAGKWPGWFYGVLSMYAGQLAASAYFGTNMICGGLDVHPSAKEMCGTDYHIHAFHTWDHFSKLLWWRGNYRDYDMTILDKNRIADYCLLIAGNGP